MNSSDYYNITSLGGLLSYGDISDSDIIILYSQWPFQEPIYWSYLPYIRPM